MSAAPAPRFEHPRVLIVGIDGGDPDLLLRFADEGRLPALAGLRKRGVWARLAGPSSVSTHSTWPSIVSGVSALDHGCYARRGLAPGSYRLERAVHPRPWWLRGPEASGPVAVIDVPGMAPQPDPTGAQLFDWGAHPCTGPPRSNPPELLREVTACLGAPIETDERLRTPLGDRRVYRRLLERVARKGALCRQLLDQARFETLLVVFGDAHAASHRFWRYSGLGSSTPSRDPVLREALARVHEAIDAEIARLLDRAGDAHVFVVSNQGVREGSPDVGITRRLCETLGYLRRLPGAGSEGRGGSLRRALGLGTSPAPGDPYAGTDWARTRAFPIPATYSGLIRINLRGREPEGCVAPEDYDAELDRLEADLRELVDARTGQPAVQRLVRTTEAFGTPSPPERLPDLFVSWAPRPHRSTELVHPRARLRVRTPRFARLNLHTREGLVVAAGPSIRPMGDLGSVEPADLAPAFRRAVGRPAPGDETSALVARGFLTDTAPRVESR